MEDAVGERKATGLDHPSPLRERGKERLIFERQTKFREKPPRGAEIPRSGYAHARRLRSRARTISPFTCKLHRGREGVIGKGLKTSK